MSASAIAAAEKAAGAKPGPVKSLRDWASRRERGWTWLLRLMIWISLHLGTLVTQTILFGIAFYFFASSRAARVASRDFLRRARGRPISAREVFRQFHVFSSVILDRVFFLTGRMGRFSIEVEGLAAMVAATEGGRGCVLLGAHLGSFEALRGLGRRAPVRVRPVMYRANNSAVSAVLEALAPGLLADIIEIGRPDTMLQVRDALGRGEIVGMLADRSPGDGRVAMAPFFGEPAAFPTGPFIVAAGLDVPAFLLFGVRVAPRHYRLSFEPFADSMMFPRATRRRDIEVLVGRYAARLEARCRLNPDNWFNFFSFWSAP